MHNLPVLSYGIWMTSNKMQTKSPKYCKTLQEILVLFVCNFNFQDYYYYYSILTLSQDCGLIIKHTFGCQE